MHKPVKDPPSSRFSSLCPQRGATVSFLGLRQFCPLEWKQREANHLLVLTGRAGSTSGMSAGDNLERDDGIHLQQFFPGA